MDLMDTKIVWLCRLLFPVVYFEAVLSLNCMLPTRSCPSTMAEWHERERLLNCTGKRYTCMMTHERILVEACMWNSKIMSGTVGCPYIATCDSTYGPILISEEKYFSCSETLDGCPKSNHTGYSVSEMYKFPMCWLADKSTKLQTTTHLNQQIQTTSDHHKIHVEVKGDKHIQSPTVLGILITVTVAVALTGVVLVLVCFFKRRKLRTKGECIKPSLEADINKV